MWMASIKLSRPEPFAGRRNALTIKIWLYPDETFLKLDLLGNPQLALDESAKIASASHHVVERQCGYLLV